MRCRTQATSRSTDKALHNSPKWSTCKRNLIRCKWWASRVSGQTSKSRWCSSRCSISRWTRRPSKSVRCNTNSFCSSSRWVTRRHRTKRVTTSTLPQWTHLSRCCSEAVPMEQCMGLLPLSLLKFTVKSSSICNSRQAEWVVRSANVNKESSTRDKSIKVKIVGLTVRCNLEGRSLVYEEDNVAIGFHITSANLLMIKG